MNSLSQRQILCSLCFVDSRLFASNSDSIIFFVEQSYGDGINFDVL